MSKYEAKALYPGGDHGMGGPPPWGVSFAVDAIRTSWLTKDWLTEAEAKIIAFALNAVSDGHDLARVMGESHHFIDLYDGPTKGVAPRAGSGSVSGTTVINMRGHHGRALVTQAKVEDRFVVIARPSKWGNPFRIGHDGERADVVARYRQHLMSSPELLVALPELEGKVLGCWCKPALCHGDVLIELLAARRSGPLITVPARVLIFGGLA